MKIFCYILFFYSISTYAETEFQTQTIVDFGDLDSKLVEIDLEAKKQQLTKCLTLNQDTQFIIKFLINKSGKVSNIVRNTTAYNAKTNNCIEKILRETTFSRPVKSEYVKVTYTIEKVNNKKDQESYNSTQDEKMITKSINNSPRRGFFYGIGGSPKGSLVKRTVILGSIDPEIVRKRIEENIPLFRNCYQQVLEKSGEGVRGAFYLKFDIESSGHVIKLNIEREKDKTPFPQYGIECIRNVLNEIKFPAPKGGGKVLVAQPLNFDLK